jgi:hypothetical protein
VDVLLKPAVESGGATLEGGGGTAGSNEPAPGDERVRGAWHAWLRALASDPEAAMAAALSYEALDAVGRTRWLDALDQDAPEVAVPKLALYAPLLSVETDTTRRSRIEAAVSTESTGLSRSAGRALRGVAPNGDRIVVVVLPLYLDFVHMLACRLRPYQGFVWVRRDPLLRRCDAPQTKTELDGVALESLPLKPVVEELAHAIVAHRRSGEPMPEGLEAYADLFRLGDDEG